MDEICAKIVKIDRFTESPVALTTEGPSWWYPVPGLGAVSPFLEPFCGHLSPKVDKIIQK